MFIRAKFVDFGLDMQRISSPLLSYWDKESICIFANEAYAATAGIVLDGLFEHRKSQIASLPPIKESRYVRSVLEGKMQVFLIEEESLPRQSKAVIASYSPVFENGEVEGFYFHVAELDLNRRYI